MARPPMDLETYGKITRFTLKGVPSARANYRDSDGRTRRMVRTGSTEAEAERKLKKALRDRLSPSDSEISGMSRVQVVLDEWWEEWLAAKERPIGTERRYKGVLDLHVAPALGNLTIAEANVTRLDRFLKRVHEQAGYSTASIAKVVLSGAFGLATRHGAVRANPIASVAAVPKPKLEVKSFDLASVRIIRAQLREWDSGKDKSGRRRVSDLADPVDMMLATGCRIGEVLAIHWEDIDFTVSPPRVDIRGTVIRTKAKKIDIQAHPKSDHSKRGLLLPEFAETMLMRRRLDSLTKLVFPSSTGTIRHPNNFRVQWHAALGDTPFSDDVPKTLRSSVATMIAMEVGADAAKEQLGHSSVTVSEKSYIAKTKTARDVTETLEQFGS